MLKQNSEAANRCVAEEYSQENNDTCYVCCFGGNIILCEGCPSSFHAVYLDLNQVLEGNWYCQTCCCRICCQPRCKKEFANDSDTIFMLVFNVNKNLTLGV